MTESSNVSEVRRIEKMVSYSNALGDFCSTYYNAEEPYTPHGECPFWSGSVCVLQDAHPSDWGSLEIVLNNKVEEG